ncbi:MAG: aminotransferase class IV [Flavobacteriaceae bacterium]|nr:aminotransferase class IV [Flavobacteriaceae bacterium]
MIGFHNENYIEVSKISLPITSTTINRSYAAFEFFTLANNKPFYLDRHLQRLFKTLEILRIQIEYSKSTLEKIIINLIDKNPIDNISFKIFVIPETLPNSDYFKGDVFIFPFLNAIQPISMYKTGAKLLIKEYHRFLPTAKTTNYTASVYWENEISKQHAIDVLFCNGKTIKETSRSNIFIIKNNIIYTPITDILYGITRSIAIDLIQKNKLILIEKEISIEELILADEVFITSTTREIMPITNIDSTSIGDGKVGNISHNLIHDFRQLKMEY